VSAGVLLVSRARHSATLLDNGTVLIAGGQATSGPSAGGMAAAAEIFNPVTATFTPTAALIAPRRGHSAVLLPDGNVLLAGGEDNAGAVGAFETFNAGTGLFQSSGPMVVPRGGSTATWLPEQATVFVAGGWGPSAASWNSAEYFDPPEP